MTTENSFAIYIVTIARAKERLRAIIDSTKDFGLDLRPIDGVDGKTLAEKDWKYINRSRFMIRSGRMPLAGEYGCYASHLIAMEEFLKDGGEFAVIVEDDVRFDAQAKEQFEKLIAVAPKNSLVKLTCHRRCGFRAKKTFDNGITLGRYFFGPQGSSACYLISRQAAETFLRRSAKMTAPFDRAIENGWDNGINVLNTDRDILNFGEQGTMIASIQDYRSTKFHPILRIPSYLKGAYDNIARLVYALL
jgi:glycosyl transferase family 25